MAQKMDNDLLMEDELAAAFLDDDQLLGEEDPISEDKPAKEHQEEDAWDDEDTMPGQLAVDVYETDDRLIVKARTAGVEKKDLDVSISEGMLTISGT